MAARPTTRSRASSARYRTGLIQEVRLSNAVKQPFAGSRTSPFAQAPVPETTFSLGQPVRHALFGDGVILNYEGSGAHARVAGQLQVRRQQSG